MNVFSGMQTGKTYPSTNGNRSMDHRPGVQKSCPTLPFMKIRCLPGLSGNSLRSLAVPFLALVFVSLTANCATYWTNRARDSGDLFSAGIQQDSYGVSFRAGPAKMGLHYKDREGLDMGYRQGYVDQFQSQSFSALLLGSDILTGPIAETTGKSSQSDDAPTIRNSNQSESDPSEKTQDTRDAQEQLEQFQNMELEDIKKLPAFQQLSPQQQEKFIEQFKRLKEQPIQDSKVPDSPASEAQPPTEMETRKKTYQARSPLGTSVPFKDKNPLLKPKNRQPVSRGLAPGSYLTSFELKAGIYGGIYLAFHAGELIDLLAGFMGMDPMGDDGPFEMGRPSSDLDGLSEAEKKLLEKLPPEQRNQFLELSPEERKQLLERANQR